MILAILNLSRLIIMNNNLRNFIVERRKNVL